ncbi:MAG: sulfatase-like hydrolase/transferase, partial [Planctomycetota bacterium]
MTPNILFFFSDQQRWDTCGCYGQPLEVTPNLDRMAAEGVRFENAFTCQPVCGPARACLQTGHYATATGCFRNNIALRENERTVAHALSEGGYEVGYIGKWHLASTGGLPDRPDLNNREDPVPAEMRGGWKDYWLASDVLEFTSHGFGGHMWDGDGEKVEFEGYRVDRQTDFVLDYLRARDGKRPWFLFLSYIEPHHQNNHKHYEGPEGSKERFRNFVVPGDLEGTEGDWREEYPDYLGCCAALDAGLGRIRAELEKLGLAGNTLIVYSSDHGSHFRTRNDEYKRAPHDGCLRIPMVACGPGFRG